MGVEKRKKSVKKNAILSVIKQLLSVVFPMITFPYATRILGADNYGKYTFSVSIVNYISYLAAAGIMRYAIRECARARDDENKLNKIVNEIFTINVLTTGVAYLVLFFILAFVPMLRAYAVWIMIISLSVIFTTLGTDWINSAFEEYSYITVRYFLSQIFAILLLFLLVKDSDDIAQYAFVSVFGGVFANVLNVFYVRKKLGINPKIVISKELLIHIKPVLYLFACTIATFIYINSDVTILRIFSNDVSVGYYGVSTQFYQLVKQLINAAFVVVIPRLSNEIAQSESMALEKYRTILRITVLILFPCAVGLFMIRYNVIMIFAGAEFIQATSSLAILSVALVPAMLANFYINIVMIPLKREKQVMIATIVSAIVNIVLNLVIIPLYSGNPENVAAFTTLVAELTMTTIAIYYCKSLKIMWPIKSVVVSAVGCLLIVMVCMAVNHLVTESFINVALCIMFSAIVYGIAVGWFYKKEVKAILFKIHIAHRHKKNESP